MRPQDILILLKKISADNRKITNKQLSEELGISASEVSEGLERCRVAKLVDTNKQRVNTLALEEFLVHGLKYVFPVVPQAKVRGMATSISALPLSRMISSGEGYVWPDSSGDSRGEGIAPLYRSVVKAAERDECLYRLLALTDAFRIGRTREVELAKKELKKIFTDYDVRECNKA